MNTTRRCIYNAVRDKAAGNNGVACYAKSLDDLSEQCQVSRRHVKETLNAFYRHGHILKAGNLRCYVPLHPDQERREAFFVALERMGTHPRNRVVLARAAFMLEKGRDVADVGMALGSLTPDDVAAFMLILEAAGFWGEDRVNAHTCAPALTRGE